MIIVNYTKAKGTIDEKLHENCYIEIVEARGKDIVTYDIKIIDNTRIWLVDYLKNFSQVVINHELPTAIQLYNDLKTYFDNPVDYVRPVQEIDINEI